MKMMNTKMFDEEINKSQEPSVLSLDPKERKLARMMQIQRRSAAMRYSRQVGIEDEEIIEKTQTEKQIDASDEMIEKLITEGNEVISNVRVANDAREIQRREDDIAIRNALLTKLENDAKESAIKYEDISCKWSSMLSCKDPLDIYADIQSQNAKCVELLTQKDVVIAELKRELENADKRFVDDQKKQNEDINILIERIDNQINIIAKAYRRELRLIEDVLKNERIAILQNITKKWDDLYDKQKNNDMFGVERRREIMREYEKEINRALIEHQEQYRVQKIRLETECEKVQQEIENMKVSCLMNIEKLDYNYAVLKRREDENKILKNQQTRRINKLQDTINDLKKSCAELEQSTRLKIDKLQNQVDKSHKNIHELELKSNHFTAVNDKQYMQLWEMNTKNADKLLDEIFKVDKIVYEQILGMDWEPPEINLLKKEDLPSYRGAMRIIENSNIEQKKVVKLYDLQKKQSSPETINLEKKILSHILNQIADQTGFLIEDKLRECLSTYSQIDQTIITLDNVFHALNIQSEDQVYLLLYYFLPYSYCSSCEIKEQTPIVQETAVEDSTTISKIKSVNDVTCPCDTDNLDEPTGRLVKEIVKQISLEPKYNDESITSIKNSLCAPQEHLLNDNKITDNTITDNSRDIDIEKRNLTCDKGHLLEIKSTYILKALREFVEKCNAVNDETVKKSLLTTLQSENYKSQVILSRSISEKDMIEYWQRYRDIFSSKKEEVWDALMIGLNKYHDILKERQKLISETESLRRQNEELRRLLETCKPNISSSKERTRSAFSRIA